MCKVLCNKKLLRFIENTSIKNKKHDQNVYYFLARLTNHICNDIHKTYLQIFLENKYSIHFNFYFYFNNF